MSREAFIENPVPAYVIDLICGKQGRTPTGRGAMPDRYTVFPIEMQNALRRQTEAGANLLVSGASIASDPQGEDATFVEQLLGIKLATAFGTNTGHIANIPFSNTLNPDIYCVERPDAFKVTGKDAKAWLRYPGSNMAAAVYYKAENYSAVSIGVPIETVLRAVDREWLFSQALDYLYNGKKPANRR